VLKSQTDLCALANNIPLKINGAVLQIIMGNIFRIRSFCQSNMEQKNERLSYELYVIRCLLQAARPLVDSFLNHEGFTNHKNHIACTVRFIWQRDAC
jgi:hypothetical protein